MAAPLPPPDAALLAKREAVLAALRALPPGRLAVAFSGGVDSTLLLALAAEARGGAGVLAVTAHSASLAGDELRDCEALASRLGVELRLLETRELEREGYRQNGPDRCYHCKSELFERLDEELRRAESISAVVYGATADDLGDHRPGMRAAGERAVGAPLADAGLGKAEIRALSQAMGLPTWDKPAMPCLASRVPYGQEVTPGKLARIEGAEALLRGLGLREVRVRHHGEESAATARIEAPLAELPRLLEEPVRARLVAGLRQLGFLYVTLDLEGFRSGRLNEALAVAGRALPLATSRS